MSQTKIEWADAVWNPISGCSPVSAGCRNCYAKRMANRLRGRFGYPADEPFRVTLHPDKLDEPLKRRKPRRVFVCSMGDLFHKEVPVEFIAEIFDRMACATLACGKKHQEHEEECWTGDPHTFIVLTKRPQRMLAVLTTGLDYATTFWPGDRPLIVARQVYWPLPNLWLGVSVEDQATADERIPILLKIPAAKRFVSLEPMLSPVDLSKWQLSWCVLGAETGPGARPMNLDWARAVRDQCQEVGVPFFFKRASDGSRLLDGRLWEEWPR